MLPISVQCRFVTVFQRFGQIIALCTMLLAVAFDGQLLCAQDDHGQTSQRTWRRGPLELTVHLSDESPFVSDQVAIQLRAKAPADMDVELPKLDGFPKDFQLSDVRSIGPASEPDGGQVWELNFKLEMLRAGQIELPALVVRYRSFGDSQWATAETEPIPIEFRSMLGDEPDAARPRPNPAPLDWPLGWLFWVLFMSAWLAILLAVLGGWMFWSSRPRKPIPSVPVSPYQKAMEGIRRIEVAGYLERGEVERFYTELSGVLRHYIEDRFGLHAPEQTTEEFLQELTGRPVLVERQRHALTGFLEQCDLVKFAKVRPSKDEGTAALEAARAFVEATRACVPSLRGTPEAIVP
jgi:hypothetical protein